MWRSIGSPHPEPGAAAGRRTGRAGLPRCPRPHQRRRRGPARHARSPDHGKVGRVSIPDLRRLLRTADARDMTERATEPQLRHPRHAEPKPKHLVLAGVAMLRCPFTAFRAALSMTRLKLLLTRLKFWGHPSIRQCLTPRREQGKMTTTHQVSDV